jgi:hypothetical protein
VVSNPRWGFWKALDITVFRGSGGGYTRGNMLKIPGGSIYVLGH